MPPGYDQRNSRCIFFIFNSLFSQLQSSKEATTQFKLWQSSNWPHHYTFLISWVSACEIRTDQTRVIKLCTWQWNFIHHGRSVRILICEASPKPPYVMHLLFYKYYVVDDGDDVTKKDPEKPLWKNEQNSMTVCWFLRMRLDDLKVAIQMFYWSKKNSWDISSRIQIECLLLQLPHIIIPRGRVGKKNMGFSLCFWASASFLHPISIVLHACPSVDGELQYQTQRQQTYRHGLTSSHCCRRSDTQTQTYRVVMLPWFKLGWGRIWCWKWF